MASDSNKNLVSQLPESGTSKSRDLTSVSSACVVKMTILYTEQLEVDYNVSGYMIKHSF
jgi:hypothetical protein